MITHDPEQIKKLRKSGQILATVLGLVASKVKPGVTAAELDELAESKIRSLGGIPAFKGHKANPSEKAFPASLCVSINDEVVHGIPSKEKVLQDGDIVGLDLGVIYGGLYTDSAITVAVGKIDSKLVELVGAARKSLDKGLEQVKPGNHIGDIGCAIEKSAQDEGFVVVRDLVGHGVGESVWEEPEVPCFGKPGSGVEIKEGMVLAIEPMLNMENWRIKFEADGWTVKTQDNKPSAHFEHTVLVTKDGCEIITQRKIVNL
ncbi:MAG: type I methionyl aminopeptidase [bacterium]|nr:type I methionyl aminopeptidase [bacterium]